jgi:exonuclease SbcC
MFDFLFKRRSAGSSNSAVADQTAAAASAASAERSHIRQQAREHALQQAAALTNERDALAFIVASEFAEARLVAAPWLLSAAALGEALKAIRNSDRRVAKLLQTRLDDLQRQQRAQAQMQAVLARAECLLADPMLTPDRAADTDRAWAAAGGATSTDTTLTARFAVLREALSERLVQQAQLQRFLIDTRTQLQRLIMQLDMAQGANVSVVVAEVAQDADTATVNGVSAKTLEALAQQIAQARTATEATVLPKALLPECDRLLEQCHAGYMRALQERSRTTPSQAAPSSASADAVALVPLTSVALTADVKNTLPFTQEKPVPAARQSGSKPPLVPVTTEQRQQWRELLERLETALEEGALQSASETERIVRAIDVRAIKPDNAETSRLNAAYASLHHLQGWARWGGNISREELLQAALTLQGQSLPVPELVQKIGGLRARWKLLSVSAGPAPQALWEQFDAACSVAYAPAAAQFAIQDRERQQNRVLAEALIAEAVAFSGVLNVSVPELNAGLDDASVSVNESAVPEPDWKLLAQFEARMRQSWQRLGPLGHKEKRLLEKAFNHALKSVQTPLRERQKVEIAAREFLISEVLALAPDDRQGLEKLRRIQSEWQQHAQSVPLSRKDEQALWQSFRAGCDAVFARRKETEVTQDTLRQTHLEEKQAVCEQLEQVLSGNPDPAEFDFTAAQAALQQARTAWTRSGPVPRSAERAIEQRYKEATDTLQKRVKAGKDAAADAAIAAESELIETRLAMCFALDAGLVNNTIAVNDADDLRISWQNLAPVLPAVEKVLRQRFDTALAAVSNPETYLPQLQQQRATFDNTLLEAEIALGLESPPELARLRMQLQVALLQSSLKAGAGASTGHQHLLRLCALPAIADATTLARVATVVRHALKA